MTGHMTKTEYLANCYARDKQTVLCRDFMTLKHAFMCGARRQNEIDVKNACDAVQQLMSDLNMEMEIDIDTAKEYLKRKMTKI